MEELERVPKELKVSATLQVEQQYELINTPPPELMSLAAYVAEDGLVGHHWEERLLDLANMICPSTGECQGQEVGICGQVSRMAGGYRELLGQHLKCK